MMRDWPTYLKHVNLYSTCMFEDVQDDWFTLILFSLWALLCKEINVLLSTMPHTPHLLPYLFHNGCIVACTVFLQSCCLSHPPNFTWVYLGEVAKRFISVSFS